MSNQSTESKVARIVAELQAAGPVSDAVIAAIEAAYAAGCDDGVDSTEEYRGVYGADSDELKNFADAYAGLGEAVGCQVWDLIDGQTYEDGSPMVNANAIALIEERLGGMNREIDEAIASFNDGEFEKSGREFAKSDECVN